jgi:hypothetical protein
MLNDLVVIVPSRHRPDSIAALLICLEETQTRADLIVAIDDDDEFLNEYHALTSHSNWRSNYYLKVNPRQGKGMAKPLNLVANQVKYEYRHFAFIGDDHRPRTQGWDRLFVEALDSVFAGIVYGDDLVQGEGLATAIAMSGTIVSGLNGMVPDGFIHMYLDNFWMKLGADIGALIYLDDVVIEHLHPIAGKAKMDEQYATVNNAEVMGADLETFRAYIASLQYTDLVRALT